MKKILMNLLAVFLIGIGTVSAQTTTIHCWDFNTPPAANNFNTSPIDVANRVAGNGTITHTFNDVATFGGNAAFACAGSVAGAAFCPRPGLSLVNNGASMTLQFPTTGYENAALSFEARRTATGFDSVFIAYSTNGGTTFTNIFFYSPSSSAFGQFNVDFSAIPAAQNNPNFQVRFTFNGGTSATGNNRIDNVKLEGTVLAANPGLTNPTPFNLAGGNYSFDAWAATATSGTYPANMAFWYTTDPSVTGFNPLLPGTVDYTCAYNLTARPRFNGLGANGVSVISTGSPQYNNCASGAADTTNYAGSIVAAINTTGRENVRVTWFNEILNAPGRNFGFRLQYRNGINGNFTDVPGPIEYNTTGKTQGDTTTITAVLPAALNNIANLQLRWAYFQVGTGSGTRPEIRFDNLTITSDALTTPVYPISAIRGVNAQGVADSLNVTCNLSGLVSGGNLRTSGAEFWLISPNNDAGILVRSTSLATYTVAEGDALFVRGQVQQFRGLLQFVPDSIYVISSNNTLPTPATITTLDESTEGRLVVFPFLTLVSGWTPAGSGFNALVTDGTTTFTARVLAATSLFNLPAPATPFSLRGHGSQFAPSTTAPFVGGYQIQPRAAADLTPIIATQPTANFLRGAVAHLEGAGTVPVRIIVNPAATTAGTLYIGVANGPNILPGDYTTTPAAVANVIAIPVAVGADTVAFNLNIVNNTVVNPNKTITFILDSATTGVVLGALTTKVVTIIDDDLNIPTYPIAQVATVNAQGVADSVGVMCKLVGTVLGVDMSGVASPAISFTIHDGVKGIGVFGAAGKAIPYMVTEGDQVRIIGTIGQFRGLTQMNVDSVVVLSTNNPLPTTPVLVTALGEATESELIRINNVSVVNPSQWTNAGSGMTVEVSNGTTTFAMRIDADVNVFGTPVPTGTFDVVGIGGQFNPTTSAPFLDGYQILPRYINDIIFPVRAELSVTEIMAGSNDPNSTLRQDWFEITNYGTTATALDGFSWSHDVEIPGRTQFPSGITIQPGEAVVVLNAAVADTAAWKTNWRIGGQPVQIITSDVMTGPFPNIKQGADLVVLYDDVNSVLCRAVFNNAPAGRTAEFNNDCLFIGFGTDGTRGAYFSNGGDQGSPGNKMPSIGVNDFAVQFNMYPNPAKEAVTISFGSDAQRQIELVTVLGTVVRAATAQNAAVRFSISGLPAGMYLVRITEGGQSGIRRLIIQ